MGDRLGKAIGQPCEAHIAYTPSVPCGAYISIFMGKKKGRGKGGGTKHNDAFRSGSRSAEKSMKASTLRAAAKTSGHSMRPDEMPKTSKFSALQEKFKRKLEGARFRTINEKLYTCRGEEAFTQFQNEPDLFDAVSIIKFFYILS